MLQNADLRHNATLIHASNRQIVAGFATIFWLLSQRVFRASRTVLAIHANEMQARS
jgi:hypothetical protein